MHCSHRSLYFSHLCWYAWSMFSSKWIMKFYPFMKCGVKKVNTKYIGQIKFTLNKICPNKKSYNFSTIMTVFHNTSTFLHDFSKKKKNRYIFQQFNTSGTSFPKKKKKKRNNSLLVMKSMLLNKMSKLLFLCLLPLISNMISHHHHYHHWHPVISCPL